MRKKLVVSKKEIIIKLLLIFVLAICTSISTIFSNQLETWLNIGKAKNSNAYFSASVVGSSNFQIHFIDVGQADSTLILLPDNKTMLIDTGDQETATKLSNYLKQLSLSKIDYLVLTHADSDHVGGATKVLENFEVENIYRPFQISAKEVKNQKNKTEEIVIAEEDLANLFDYLKQNNSIYANKVNVVTSKVYQNTIKAIYNETYTAGGKTQQSNVYINYDGLSFGSEQTANYQFEFFAPLLNDITFKLEESGLVDRTKGMLPKVFTKSDTNSISPMIELRYNGYKFVFTGDMTDKAEAEVINSLSGAEREKLSDVTIFQAGHHGASESNSSQLLNLLNPLYTVVSCGKNNTYGHPAEDFLDRLASLNHRITDYLVRTDLQGNIVFGIKDGKLMYNTNVVIESDVFTIYWWQIAVGIFVVGSILILSIRLPSTAVKQKSRPHSKK